MRVKYGSLATLCLLLLALLPASCIQDEYAAKEKATLTLYFTTTKSGDGTSSDATTVGPELPNEHMRTLRVIIADKNGKIRYNTKVNVPQEQTETILSFSELIVDTDAPTNFDVYAIANEEVFNTNNEWEGVGIELTSLKNKVLDSDVLDKLNEGIGKNDYESGYALPQTAIQEVSVIPGKDNSAKISLDFVVAKVELNVKNNSLQSQQLTDVKISNMNLSESNLFSSENVPVGDQDLIWDAIDVPQNGESHVVKYVYESTIEDNYWLTTTWGNNNNLNLTEEGLGKSFLRGNKLIINVTLNSQQEASLDFLVIPWNLHEIDVPEFQ